MRGISSPLIGVDRARCLGRSQLSSPERSANHIVTLSYASGRAVKLVKSFQLEWSSLTVTARSTTSQEADSYASPRPH
jgi:hypothetical protein